jgi:SpoIID/LytB domain protein
MSKRLVILLALILVFFFGFFKVAADELADIEKQLAEAHALLDESKKATEPLEANLKLVESKINNAEAQIGVIETEINRKKQEISLGEKDLIKQKQIINERARNYYKQSRGFLGNMLGIVLSKNLPEASRMFFYQQQGLQRDRDTIIKTAFFIRTLEEKKTNLEEEQTRLAVLKKELDQEKAYFASEVAKAKNYQSSLEQKIAALYAKQQEIIASRIAGLNLPRSAGSGIQCVDDRNLDPGFGTGFAFYTYGIPHRVGMSQYGAYGRASRGGEDYKTILNAYFQNISIECYSIPSEIQVDGFGPRPFEDYIKGVVNREMGADIPEALKAQAVAARSYALAYTDSGQRSICATQDCQVYSDDRRQSVNDAVDATGINSCGEGRAEVMLSDGKPIKAWFASTFGGYAHTSAEIWGGHTSWTKNFADVSGSVNSFSELQANAWDKESKCFYTAQGSRAEYGNSAWLKPSEVADIANTLLLIKTDPPKECFLYQTDKSPPPPNTACPQTDNWSADKVKSMISNPFNNVTDVRVTGIDFNSGTTTEIVIVENGREERFSGSEFKDRFNLRAPGNISIVGPLYNIEKR